MKTDPFDDAIRRKLEGVNPQFQDKNWTQFQRFMGVHGFPPSLWQTPTRWLQPALTAAAVTGVLITTIWQYQANKSLTEHVQTLTKSVERMEQVQTRLQQSVEAMNSVTARVDTIYLTQSAGSLLARASDTQATSHGQYGSQPARRAEIDQPFRGSGEATASAPLARASRQRTQPQVDEPVSRGTQLPVGPMLTGRATEAGGNNRAPDQRQQANDMVAELPPATVAQRNAGRSVSPADPITSEQSGYRAAETAGSVPIPPEIDRVASHRSGTLAKNSQSSNYQSTNTTNRLPQSNESTLYSPSVTNQTRATDAPTVNSAITATGPLATVQLLAPLPFSEPTEALAESWQRHLRRVRYRSPYMTSTEPTITAQAAAPEKHTTPLPVTFRLGVGGDVGTSQSGLGVYAEAIVANRWTISTGLSHISWLGDEYPSEQVFTAKTKHDFRRDYPGVAPTAVLGPNRPPVVMDINRAGQALVIPVQLGYRISSGKLFTFTPFVGLNISINPHETVRYTYERMGYRDDFEGNITVKRPLAWYSSLSVGVGIERQWGRFTGQVSPVVLMPVTNIDACLNSTSVGLRGRLYYRF